MRVERIPSPSFMGVPSGLPERRQIILSKRELATLQAADRIIDKMREAIKNTFPDAVDLPYGLHLDELALGDGTFEWTDYDRDHFGI